MNTPAEDPKRRSNLGRGLASIFGEEKEDYAAIDKVRGGAKSVPVEFLRPSKFQPRQVFDEAELASLSESIKDKGILQPILVRRDPERPEAYEIIAGERRWRAAQLAQLHEVPIIIREMTDRDALEIALVENVQRKDLNAIEEAEAYQRLMNEFGHTQEELSRAVGKSRSHVANTLRLLTLSPRIKSYLAEGKLQPGHARVLINDPEQDLMAVHIVDDGLSVRDAEHLAQAKKLQREGKVPVHRGRGRPPKLPKDTDTLALERDLSNLLGLKVSITFSSAGGELRIEYKTLDQLDDVLRRLKKPVGPLDN
jgi:ParB family transcriptional regulator, chromosome partitioning protein